MDKGIQLTRSGEVGTAPEIQINPNRRGCERQRGLRGGKGKKTGRKNMRRSNHGSIWKRTEEDQIAVTKLPEKKLSKCHCVDRDFND